jgi:uncharacterized membrane protein
MPRFDNINELPYTFEQLDYFEREMKKYRLPKYVQFWKKAGVWFIRNTFLPALIIIAVFGFLYMSDRNYGQRDWMWTLDKTIALFYIIGFGLWTLSSHLLELYSTNKLRRRLGLPKWHFQVLVIAFQITGMD